MSVLELMFLKSEIIGIRVNEGWLEVLADFLRCKAGSLPTSYLGLPLGNGAAYKTLWRREGIMFSRGLYLEGT